MFYVGRCLSRSSMQKRCINSYCCSQEWITSFPLHLDLYAALKVEPPTFAHFPILLNPDGSKMSKRHGDIRVDDFIVGLSTFPSNYALITLQKRGWEPDAVLNWL